MATTKPPAASERPPMDKLTAAMAAADEPEVKNLPEATAEAEAALAEPIAKPVFTAHSNALASQFNGIGEGIKAQIAEVDAAIALKQAEREDLMLAYSMLSHGMLARERGAN